MYGRDKVNSWIKARHNLLREPVRKVFTNDFMITADSIYEIWVC